MSSHTAQKYMYPFHFYCKPFFFAIFTFCFSEFVTWWRQCSIFWIAKCGPNYASFNSFVLCVQYAWFGMVCWRTFVDKPHPARKTLYGAPDILPQSLYPKPVKLHSDDGEVNRALPSTRNYVAEFGSNINSQGIFMWFCSLIV